MTPTRARGSRDSDSTTVTSTKIPILEVADWTEFPAEFTHVSEGTSRAEDLHLSVCAVLVAEACNIGLEPLVEPGRAALTRARLSWVEQNYLSTDTLTAANTRLVDARRLR